MTLEPGVLDSSDNFVNPDCMAKYIEDVMNVLIPLPPPSPTLTQDVLDNIKQKQRLFFIAISSGVIQYLKKHAGDSFEITLTLSSSGDNATLTIH